MTEFIVPETVVAEDKLFSTLVERLGLSDRADLQRRLSIAGWDIERMRAECEHAGALDRLDRAVETKVAPGLERSVCRQMRSVLSNGLEALAEDSVPSLAELISDPTLRRIALEYEPKAHGGRLVCGPTGIGKSVTGAAILRRCAMRSMREQLGKPPKNAWEIDRGHSGRICWVRAFDLPNARLGHGLGHGEAPLVAHAMTAEFLVLDDLGWESKRATADDVIVEVIATRYDAGRITYATTGLRLDQFQERYSSAIVRRLTEAGRVKGKVISCWTKDGAK